MNMEYDCSENDAIAVLRIFVFNFNFEDAENYSVVNHLKGIVNKFRVDPDIITIVPPEGSCEGGSKVSIICEYIKLMNN